MAVQIPDPHTYRIGTLLTDNRFLVPLYQRNYAWGPEETEDFWRDLDELVIGNQTSHFFGQMVTYRNENGVGEIIDGQQRLTTTSLFLAVLRDIATRVTDEGSAELAETEILDMRLINNEVNKKLIDTATNEPTLVVEEQSALNQDTPIQTYFMALTHQDTNHLPEATLQAQKNLKTAYDLLYRRLKETIWQQKSWSNRAKLVEKYYNIFIDGFYVVVIATTVQRDAFIIFETLNTRGKDLTAADIIKNHVMYISSANLPEANAQWSEMSNHLKGDSDRITRFIRTYWSARKQLVKVNSLYRSLTESTDDLGNITQAQEFLQDLNSLVAVYDAMESPNANKANRQIWTNEMLFQQIDALARMRMVLYYPIVLAMWQRKMKQEDMVLVLNKVMAVFARHRMILNYTTNKLETGYANIAHRIYSGELNNVNAITQALDTKLLQPDSAVKAGFTALTKEGKQRGQKKWALMYMLSELIDANEDIDLYQSVFQNDDYQLVQVMDTDIEENYLTYIGNWTFIEKNLAAHLEKADTADQRAAIFNRSDLNTNKKLSAAMRQSPWNEAAIQRRQDELSQQAITIW